MRKASLGTIFLTVFLDLLGFGLVIPFLPGFARQLGASDLVAALTGAVYSLMQFLLVPIWGRLSDRIGRRPVLLASIAATAAGMVFLGFADTLVLLFLARLWSGAATANIAVAQAYIADVTPPEGRARGMGLIGMAFGLGFIFGPFVGGLLAQVPIMGRPGALPAFVAAGLSLVNLVFAFVTLPESLPREKRGGATGTGHLRRSPLDFAATRQALAHPDIGRALGINFLLVFWFAGMEQTFRLFTDDAFSMSVAQTGSFLGLVGISAAVVQGGLIGRLTRKYGEVRLLVAGLLIQVLGFGLLGFSPRVTAAPRGTLAVACVLIAGGSGLVSPSVSSYVSRRAEANAQGMMLGSLQSLSALARVLGPAMGGLLYQAISPGAPYFAGAVGMLVAAVLALGLHPPTLIKTTTP
ncbi:MAG: MFS transporter [Deltaproteobacteria bacterium]|nr:MFS transporter [Deltaproteobacteria bacterium]